VSDRLLEVSDYCSTLTLVQTSSEKKYCCKGEETLMKAYKYKKKQKPDARGSIICNKNCNILGGKLPCMFQ